MIAPRSHGRDGLIALILGLMAILVYCVMIIITLPHLEALSGLAPFDMRPLGYGLAEALDILEGLGSDGRAYYLWRQIPLDTLYPGLFALTLIYTIRWLVGPVTNSLAWAGIVSAIGAALSDYVENLGIIAMIFSWPDVPSAIVSLSSVTSISKSMLTIAAVVLVMGLAVLSLLHHLRSRARS